MACQYHIMVWEIVAAIMGIMALIHALYLDKRYTAVVKRLDARVVGTKDGSLENGQDNNGVEKGSESQMFDHVWALTTAKTQRSGNRRMIVIDTVCFIGIVFLGSSSPTTVAGAMLFILCPAPAYMLVYNLNNISDRFVKRR